MGSKTRTAQGASPPEVRVIALTRLAAKVVGKVLVGSSVAGLSRLEREPRQVQIVVGQRTTPGALQMGSTVGHH